MHERFVGFINDIFMLGNTFCNIKHITSPPRKEHNKRIQPEHQHTIVSRHMFPGKPLTGLFSFT